MVIKELSLGEPTLKKKKKKLKTIGEQFFLNLFFSDGKTLIAGRYENVSKMDNHSVDACRQASTVDQ